MLPESMTAGYDIVPSNVVVADNQGAIQYINPYGLNLSGFKIAEVAGCPLTTLWDQPQEASEAILSQLSRHGFWQGEIKHRHKENSGHWELVCLSRVESPGSAESIIIQIGQRLDPQSQLKIEELEKNCRALEERELSYRHIVESAPYSIVVTRLADSRYMMVNEAFCRRMGYSREEAVGHTPYELQTFVDPAGRARMLEVFYKEGMVDSMDLQFRAKDGTILESLFSVTPITYNGQACLLAMTVDIGELKKAQRALKESEERYRNIIMNIKEGYWEIDLKGTYTFVNEAECRIHRRTKDEMIGTRGQCFFSSKTAADTTAVFNRVFETNIPAAMYDVEIIRGDGSIATIESSSSLLRDAAGKPVGFFGISRDVSEKRKVEKELEQYRKDLEQMVRERTKALEQAQEELVKREKLAVLGKLTATVSHELRNPLGVIRSSNFYLQRKNAIPDDKVDKHFKRIEEQVVLCDRIVSELLEYTQGRDISAQKEPLKPWLEQLIEQIETARSITIERHLPDDLPPVVHDREKLRLVFINLFENAIQAINDWESSGKFPRGAYRPKISVTACQKADQLILEITDNGVGMDEKTRAKAFEPLFTTRARGTGIGLANVKKIIDEHKGSVSLKSEPDKGTTATIILPCPCN